MDGDVLSLREALERWCGPALVEAVRNEERRLSKYELDGRNRIQLTPKSERRQTTRTAWMVDPDFTTWEASWRELEHDIRGRIVDGRIHVRGVRAQPDRRTEPEAIPNAWAADFVFDFGNGTIKVDAYRFTAISCAKKPWDPAPSPAVAVAAEPVAERLVTFRPEDVAHFDHEMIFALLEEHARRVIAGPDAKLIAPGRISLIPIVKEKMCKRAKDGDLLGTASAEAEWLARWIDSKVKHYHVPSAATISKVLGKEYAVLKPRTTTAI